jgi:CRP-like cAMP-binding protein
MEQRRDIEILKRSELFTGVPDAVLAELQAASFRKRHAPGEGRCRQGDPEDMSDVVIVGRLRVTQTTPEGAQVIIRYLGPGQMAGYSVLTGGMQHPGSTIAIDDCHLFGWPATTIRDLMARHAAIAVNAASVLGARYHEMQVRLRELSTERVEQRIAHTVLRLARQAGHRTARGIEIAFPLSRQDLAEMTGTTLHTVSRTLSAWEEKGLVDSGRRRVIVCKVDALEAMAAAEK